MNKKNKNKKQKPKNIDYFNKQDFMHCSKQVHGIPNRSELIHLQYFFLWVLPIVYSFPNSKKTYFIYSIKIQSL